MSAELHQLYGGRIPKSYRLAHNHITHTPEFLNGDNGFRRFWIPPQWIRRQGWSKCPCGWWPELGVHYAATPHVEWWQSEIKQRGSLKAVHRYIRRSLRATGDMPLHDYAEIEAEIEAWAKALAAVDRGHVTRPRRRAR
jgi:hypothetical protein